MPTGFDYIYVHTVTLLNLPPRIQERNWCQAKQYLEWILKGPNTGLTTVYGVATTGSSRVRVVCYLFMKPATD